MTPFDCPNCKGHGYLISAKYECQQRAAIHPCSECACPSCGGSGIDPELVEVAAKAHHLASGCKGCDGTPAKFEIKQMQAALAALVAYWREKE